MRLWPSRIAYCVRRKKEWELTLGWTRKQRVYLIVKRGLDIAASFLALIPCALVIGIYAALIKIEDGGPVFFIQDRLGRGGKVFKFYKLRSMRMNAEFSGSGVYSEKNDPRVLKVGAFARKTSIDELPQLVINILLKGDMSLIGPRPPLTYHPWPIEQYTEEQKHMFDVRPGITGWAQVNGRKTVEWHKRIELSAWYAKNISFRLDMKIFFMTIFKVLRNDDNLNAGKTLSAAEDQET